MKLGAHLRLSPEVVLVGLPNFRHGVGLLVHRALNEAKHHMLHFRRNSGGIHKFNLRATVRILDVYVLTNHCALEYSLGSRT